MIDLYDVQMLDILPEPMRDLPKVRALSYAYLNAQRRVLDMISASQVVSGTSRLDIDVIDALAAEEASPYYDDSASEATRRKDYANTMLNFLQLGTKAAVNRMVRDVFSSGSASEWFEYGGDPFHFRIYISEDLTTEQVEELQKLLETVSNARSELDEIMRQTEIQSGDVAVLAMPVQTVITTIL